MFGYGFEFIPKVLPILSLSLLPIPMNRSLFTLLLLCITVADENSLHVLHKSGTSFDFMSSTCFCILSNSIRSELFMGNIRSHCAGYLWAVLFSGT